MSGPSPVLPPLPPSRDEASMSELMPFRSNRIRILKSPFLPFGVVTAGVAVYMFGAMGVIYGGGPTERVVEQILTNFRVIVGYILFLLGWMVHFYARSPRTVLYYVFPLGICFLSFVTPVFSGLAVFFRQVLPGGVGTLPKDAGFVATFVAHFFGAGMLEELVKALPALICVALARFLPDATRKAPSALGDLLTVRGPLDGLLMGVAAGAMFIFVETAYEYSIRAFKEASDATHGNLALAWGYALTLLLPRTFGGVAGHMAYAGVFGYFIGLSVIRPANPLKTIGIGWVAAAALHGFWNSSSTLGAWALYAAGGLAAVGFLACLLKARQIEASRAGAADTGGSIIVGFEPRPAPAAAQPAAAARPAAAPVVAMPVRPAAATPTAVALAIAGERLALTTGGRIDLGAFAALAGRGAGLVGEVVAHPRDPSVIGLRNIGSTDWTVTLVDGRSETVTPAKNVRLTAGVRIAFADGIVGLVVAS
jgi:RsiW-degrading membrane proteinase PrsW (M82 family)